MLCGLRQLPARLQRALILAGLVLAAAMVFGSAAFAQALDKPVFAVALDKLDGDRIYARTVMLAVPAPNGGHYGFILNKPTQYTLAAVFPEFEPAKAVTAPIYLGGPFMVQAIFAVKHAQERPGVTSRELLPGVWFVTLAEEIDAIIEKTPNDARYYAGAVFWKPGELAEEIRRGLLMLRPADPQRLFLPDTSTLYDDLVPPDRKPQVGT